MQLIHPGIFNTVPSGPVGNPELHVDPGCDTPGVWSAPSGCTVTSSQIQWRTAAGFSTLWISSSGNWSAVSENTDYVWGVTVENFTSGGNFQCQITFYNSSLGAISTPSNNVNINGTGVFTTTLTAPTGAVWAAWRAKPFSANYDMDWSDVSLKAA